MKDGIGSRLRLVTKRWVQNGFTLAHDETGRPVFVHGALPDETVEVTLTRVRSNHCFACVSEVLQPAPGRVPSDCAAFPACGGCSFRQISYEDELNIKRRLLLELPGMEAAFEEAAQVVHWHTAQATGYRSQAQLQSDGVSRGFFALHSNAIVEWPPQGCPNLAPELRDAMLAFQPPGPGRYAFRVAGGVVCGPEAIKKNAVVEHQILDDPQFSWSFPAGSFMQANRFLVGEWLRAWRELEPLSNQDRLVELFAGTGVVGGFLMNDRRSYEAYDSDPAALAAGRECFLSRGLPGQFRRRDLYRQGLPAGFSGQDCVLLANPPRAGLGARLARTLVESGSPALLYSSCNPQTLARDLLSLRGRNGFRVRAIRIFDFFPRTPHLEILVRLDRKG